MKMNEKASTAQTKPREMSAFEKAERTLCTMYLGENTFYEDGVTTMDRLKSYIPELTEDQCRKLLKEAKIDNKLRHAPIFWANLMLKRGYLKSADVEMVTDRVDCMADMLANYWSDSTNKHGLPKQLVKGMQKSFGKFDEYQLAKYRGEKNAVKLRDVLRIVRPKPTSDEQSALWKRAVSGELKTPETWEVLISACGGDTLAKKKVWTKLLTEKTDKGLNKLGALALLRNLRNMKECGVSEDIIRKALSEASMKKILPFQIIGAARYAPEFADVLQDKLFESIDSYEKLNGDTLFLVDTSGSMGRRLSEKSDITRSDAAGGVAAIVDRICERSTTYMFDNVLTPINRSYHGFALIDSLYQRTRLGCGTYLVDCTNDAINKFVRDHDGRYPSRVVVITDEQDNRYQYTRWTSGSPLMNLPKSCKGYMVNVGTDEHGVNYNDSSWVRVSGWSDGIVKFISEYEKLRNK